MNKQIFFHRDDGVDPKLPPLTVAMWECNEVNERLSASGPQVFDQVVYMEVTPTGQKSGVIYSPRRIFPDGKEKLDPQAIHRFRGIWEQWLRGTTPATSGTPLEEWPLMSLSLVAALKGANVHTVQQLAELPEGAFDNVKIPKVREWRAKAQAWLSDAGNAAVAVELRAELAKRDEKIEAMQVQIQSLLSAQNGGTPGFEKRRSKKRQQGEDDDIQVSLPEEVEEQFAGADEVRI